MTWTYLGKRVFYEDCGAGEAVIFLHGWGCDHSVFARFLPLLTPRYRVIAFDLPGFGASEEPETVWGVDDYTRMLETFCREQGLARPSLVCHSFGGRISLMYASRNPVARMVLTDAAGIKPRRGLSYYIKVYTYKAVKFFLLKVLRSPRLMDRYRGRTGSADYRNASDRMKAILSRTVNEDLTPLLPRISAPTLLFWGTADTATPLSDALLMQARIPDAGLVKVEGGTHFSFLEAPDLYGSVLKSFFAVDD